MLALFGILLVSLAIGTLGSKASRENQLAAALKPPSCTGAKNKDCPQEVPKKTVYKCTWPAKVTNPKDSDFGAQCVKLKPCVEKGGASGKSIQGKCQCPEICKGNADEASNKNDPGKGGEKPPEMPKLPEPPKGEGGSPSGTPPPAGTCKEGIAGGVDEKGKPCPNNTNSRIDCLLSPTSPGCSGAETPTTLGDADRTPLPAETPPASRSWSAIVTTWAKDAADVTADTVNGAARSVSNTVQLIGTGFGANSTYDVRPEDVVTYGDTRTVQEVPLVPTGGDPNQRTFAQTTGFTVQGNTGVSADLGNTPQPSPGFWNWAATQLRGFLSSF